MKTKTFELGDVLSITDGHLLSRRHMDGVYDILSWMCDSSVLTHQIPRVMRLCKPFLREQFPQLCTKEVEGECLLLSEELRFSTAPEEVVDRWLKGMEQQLGNAFEVPQLPNLGEAQRDPIEEIVSMMGPNDVIIIEC